jgi:hypothetical protein
MTTDLVDILSKCTDCYEFIECQARALLLPLLSREIFGFPVCRVRGIDYFKDFSGEATKERVPVIR